MQEPHCSRISPPPLPYHKYLTHSEWYTSVIMCAILTGDAVELYNVPLWCVNILQYFPAVSVLLATL